MCGWPGVVSLLMHPQGALAHLQREVMIEVDHSAPEAEVTGRQPDVEAIRQEIDTQARKLEEPQRCRRPSSLTVAWTASA